MASHSPQIIAIDVHLERFVTDFIRITIDVRLGRIVRPKGFAFVALASRTIAPIFDERIVSLTTWTMCHFSILPHQA